MTVYANTGASIEALKRHSGHKSTKVCELYIDNSIAYKRKTGNAITSSLNCTSTSGSTSNESFAPDEILVNNAHSLVNAGDNSGMHDSVTVGPSSVSYTNSAAASIAMQTETVHTTEFTSNNDNENEVSSQVSVSTRMSTSTQNFLAQMKKQFSFHKCDHLTINFKGNN